MKGVFIRSAALAVTGLLLSGAAPAPRHVHHHHDHVHEHGLPGSIEVTVYTSPYCGCCRSYIAYLEKHGFKVTVVQENDLDPTRARLGIPKELLSCHSAVAGGYVFEGHVPADLVERVLKERPQVVGLTIPNMPHGPPGMEGMGGNGEPLRYDVIAWDRAGQTSVYAKR
jgi:hypothetical protein